MVSSLCRVFRSARANKIEKVEKIQAANGYKQIILAQVANSYARNGQKEEAIKQYMTASESEQNWGKLKNSQVSEYIILYCAYHALALKTKITNIDLQRLEQLKLQILSLDVPEILKKHYLPFNNAIIFDVIEYDSIEYQQLSQEQIEIINQNAVFEGTRGS